MSTALLFLASLWLAASGTQADSSPNRLTEEEEAQGWELLFDGKSFEGWGGLDIDAVKRGFWVIEDDCIKKEDPDLLPVPGDGSERRRVDLFTEETFEDFELSFEWKISPGGNSGLKYNVSKEISRPDRNHRARGFEYQVIDDAHYSDRAGDGIHLTGSLYDLIPAGRKVLKPAGEFNHSVIILKGNHGEHWLNGTKVLEYDLGTPEMDALFEKSKFKDLPGFGHKRKGHIVLQDHRDLVWFRNIKIRSL